VAERTGIDWLWGSASTTASVLRAVLRPAEAAYAGIVAGRSALYDRGILASHPGALPAISIGNLTVGGTGKTPISAWAAQVLKHRGATPAIVLRGYGDDEPRVHSRLNPDIPVIVNPDRVAGLEAARVLGADVGVLDDAFQHRRARRTQDWVLISADRWTDRRRLLPAGPWRESLSALERASLVILTRKAASRPQVARLAEEMRARVAGIPVAIVHLAADELRAVDGTATKPLADLRGTRVLLIAAIGDPAALVAQLEGEGATIRGRIFADHHAFSAAQVADMASDARTGEIVVCTLKDAVKIGSWWPRAAPALWYVSQRVEVEEGLDSLHDSLETVLRARTSRFDAAGVRRPNL
jgi:tetraacyldisaccharide 4'-kinase